MRTAFPTTYSTFSASAERYRTNLALSDSDRRGTSTKTSRDGTDGPAITFGVSTADSISWSRPFGINGAQSCSVTSKAT